MGTWEYETLSDRLQWRLTQAIIRPDAIALDWGVIEGGTATTELKKAQGSTFEGYSFWAYGTPDGQKATVRATLYSNETGHILIGEETLPTGKVDWFIVHLFNGRPIS